LTEIAIAAFATALGFRMYQRADMLHKVLGAGLVVYGLLGGFLWAMSSETIWIVVLLLALVGVLWTLIRREIL